MSTKTELPALVVTNPIWLSLFRLGVEDLSWGRHPIDQHTLAVTIHELAGKITDVEMRKLIQGSAAKLLLDTAQNIVKESHSGNEHN